MLYKALGNIRVPAIGQGTQGIKDVDIIRRGISLGMTFIDTAEVYGNEEIIGQAIKGIRDKVFISTKFSPEHNGDVIKACEGSLERLGTDYIDLYSMHWPNPAIPVYQTTDALMELQKQGKIRHIGVCNTNQFGILRVSPEAIQIEYNLFDRTIESGLLPYCEQNNILTVAYSPLQYLYKLPPDRMLWLQDIAFSHQKTLAQVALNWLISHKTVIAIPKSKDYKHQAANAIASDFALSQAELTKIDNLFECRVAYIPPNLIKISRVGKFPQTLEEAKANILHFSPSPADLSKAIDDSIKPIRVEPNKGKFELVEGGLRYWAWVIRFGDKPIPSLIIGEADEIYTPTPEIQCEKHPGAKYFEVNKQKYCSKCYNELLNRSVGALKD